MKRKLLSLLLVIIMTASVLVIPASAEAGDWDPLTSPNDVYGELVGNKSFTASTTLETGKDGQLRAMPTLNSGYVTYNAMAYCGATAKSNNTEVLEVKSIEIGKWQGGQWDGADALQVTVTPKKAGTATVTMGFYYTFSQHKTPFKNPNAQWFYGTMKYTVKVTGSAVVEKTLTLSYDANGGTGAPAAESKTTTTGSAAFTISETVPTYEGYDFQGWTNDTATAQFNGGDSISISEDTTLYAVWAKHEHSGVDDGICDVCGKCLHEKYADGSCKLNDCSHGVECCPKHECKDEDDNGVCDVCGEDFCTHVKEEGYCTVEGCTHDEECCPKKPAGPVDDDGDGIEDTTGECLHEKDGDGYCNVNGCDHPETCCPKKPAGPTAAQIWESSYSGYYVTVTCNKNSYHQVKIGIKNFNDGLIVGEVTPNTGSNASRYPWVCYVEPNGEYFTEIAENNGINQNGRFDHSAIATEGMTFYGTADGQYWFADWGNTMYVTVAHD